MEEEIFGLEQSALHAMMNPHFIFNVMNSIQHFINTDDKDSANKCLVDFTKLIRMNQAISGKRVISLEDEIAFLQLYLSFEQLRFGDHLTYEIKVDPKIETSGTAIAAMMIQPFIENAIWHGILPMNAPGHLSLEIAKISDDLLRIKIEDNGVGITNKFLADHFPDQKSESYGLGVAIQRFELLRKTSDKELYMRYTHANPDKILKGTILEMALPAMFD